MIDVHIPLETISRVRRCIEEAGALWLGIQRGGRDAVLFQDPQTRSTCALYLDACQTADDVRAALNRKRELFRSNEIQSKWL